MATQVMKKRRIDSVEKRFFSILIENLRIVAEIQHNYSIMAILFLETLPKSITSKTMLVEVFEPQFAIKALKELRCVNIGDLVKAVKKGTLSAIIEDESDKNALVETSEPRSNSDTIAKRLNAPMPNQSLSFSFFT